MTLLAISAPIELQAAAGDKPRRLRIAAYTGGLMSVSGFGPVVVDLAGLAVPESFPLLADHRNELNAMVGTGSATSDGKALTVNGTAADNAAGLEVVKLLEAGHRLQASVGAEVVKSSFVEKGKSVSVNGRTITATDRGFTLVSKASLREVSLTPLGADSATSATIAAGAAGAKAMTFTAWVDSLGIQATDANRGQLEATHRRLYPAPDAAPPAETQLLEKIFDNPETRPLLARAVAEAWTEQRARQEAVAVIRAGRSQIGPILPSPRSLMPRPMIMEAALCMNAGMSSDQAAEHFEPQVLDAAMEARNRKISLQGICREVLAAAGREVPSGRLGDAEIRATFEADRTLRASGFSTVGLPGILSNAANKLALSAFQGTAAVWNRFCRTGSGQDFKAMTNYRLTALGRLEEVPDTGEIKHAKLAEAEYSNQIATYGKMIAITRKMIINDDLSMLATLPAALGRMGAVSLERAVFTKLLANPSSFFSVGNANYLSGGTSALGDTGLTAARKAFSEQVDANSDPVLIDPRVLLVPPALWRTGRSLLNSTSLVSGNTTPMPGGNVWADAFELIESPYLGTAAGLTNASNTGWYLLAGPGDFSVIEVAFLNGMASPTVESADTDFNTLGVQMRVVFDFGVATLEKRGGVLSAGA